MIPLIYLGLAVTSCDRAVAFVAKFSHVKLQGGSGSDGLYYGDSRRLIQCNCKIESYPLLLTEIKLLTGICNWNGVYCRN